MEPKTAPVALNLRQPLIDDATAIYELIRACPPLDLNSQYAYLLLCHHHAATCAVAAHQGRILGFLSAYRRPDQLQTLFVWQVAVAAAVRGQGAAGQLLEHVLQRPACAGVQWIETTVAPSNHASRRVFERFAQQRGAACERSLLFPASMFAGQNHEDEQLLRIGALHP